MPSSVLIVGCGCRASPGAGFRIFRLEDLRITVSKHRYKTAGRIVSRLRLDIRDERSFRGLARRVSTSSSIVPAPGEEGSGLRGRLLTGTEPDGNMECDGSFCSSTSVYSQMDGSLVDESSPRNRKETSRSSARQNLVLESGGVVARLASSTGRDAVSAAKAVGWQAIIERGGERVMNMLHQSGAAGALRFSPKRRRMVFSMVWTTARIELDWFRCVCEQFRKPIHLWPTRSESKARMDQ
jgi:hypothetical protein